jgi:TonB family protein
MGEGKGMAIVALALGIVGLFTAGGLVVGSLLGLGLAVAVLARRTRTGRDVAWAAVAANVVALLTVVPLAMAVVAYRVAPQAFGLEDDSLPVPATPPGDWALAPAPPAPPPPPPPLPPPAVEPAGAAPAVVPEPDAAAQAPARSRPSSPAEAMPIRVGAGIREPRKTRNVSPVYPPEAVAARVQGVVILECTISAQGKVVSVRTLRSVPMLDGSAIEAVRQWEYTPTLLNGVPVPVIMTVTVNFKLG